MVVEVIRMMLHNDVMMEDVIYCLSSATKQALLSCDLFSWPPLSLNTISLSDLKRLEMKKDFYNSSHEGYSKYLFLIIMCALELITYDS